MISVLTPFLAKTVQPPEWSEAGSQWTCQSVLSPPTSATSPSHLPLPARGSFGKIPRGDIMHFTCWAGLGITASLATSQCTLAQLYCSADYSLERTKWFRNRDLFILYFKSGCLLAWFDVSLFASSACWVNWTLKNFLFMLLHWKCSRGNSLGW